MGSRVPIPTYLLELLHTVTVAVKGFVRKICQIFVNYFVNIPFVPDQFPRLARPHTPKT
jgi:hypothetical protein